MVNEGDTSPVGRIEPLRPAGQLNVGGRGGWKWPQISRWDSNSSPSRWRSLSMALVRTLSSTFSTSSLFGLRMVVYKCSEQLSQRLARTLRWRGHKQGRLDPIVVSHRGVVMARDIRSSAQSMVNAGWDFTRSSMALTWLRNGSS